MKINQPKVIYRNYLKNFTRSYKKKLNIIKVSYFTLSSQKREKLLRFNVVVDYKKYFNDFNWEKLNFPLATSPDKVSNIFMAILRFGEKVDINSSILFLLSFFALCQQNFKLFADLRTVLAKFLQTCHKYC